MLDVLASYYTQNYAGIIGSTLHLFLISEEHYRQWIIYMQCGKTKPQSQVFQPYKGTKI